MSEGSTSLKKSPGLMKKAGVFGFVFFLAKGLAWLALPALLALL